MPGKPNRSPTLRRAPSAGGSGAPPRLRRATPRRGLHNPTHPQELWKQPHLLSLHISPPRNMSRLYHRAPKLAMACCGCPCARRALIHPCLPQGSPSSVRAHATRPAAACAQAHAPKRHTPRAHATLLRPAPAAARMRTASCRPAGSPQATGAPLFAWGHGLHALLARPRPQTMARPPRSNTPRGTPRASRRPQIPPGHGLIP